MVAGGAALVVVAAILILLFGSSGSQLSGPIAQAATVSSAVPGYRMHMSVGITGSGSSEQLAVSGAGTVDLTDHVVSLSMAMNLGDDPQVVQALGSSTMRMQMVMDGTVIYVKLPPAVVASLPISGRSWFSVDVSKLADVPGLSSLGGNPAASDPTNILKSLRSVSTGVVDEGQQRVDGFATTHYRADLNLDDLLNDLPAAQRSELQQTLSDPQYIPVDVWIDASHLVRRIVMSSDLAPAGGGSMQEAVTVDFSDYGPQPRPSIPSPDQVQDLSGLLGAASR